MQKKANVKVPRGLEKDIPALSEFIGNVVQNSLAEGLEAVDFGPRVETLEFEDEGTGPIFLKITAEIDSPLTRSVAAARKSTAN